MTTNGTSAMGRMYTLKRVRKTEFPIPNGMPATDGGAIIDLVQKHKLSERSRPQNPCDPVAHRQHRSGASYILC